MQTDMTTDLLATRQQELYGLIELDEAGTVLYSRLESDWARESSAPDLQGRNFYTEVAPFENVKEFQQCVDRFGRSAQQSCTLDFACQYKDGLVKVRVLMARIRERAEQDVMKSIFIHIRKVY